MHVTGVGPYGGVALSVKLQGFHSVRNSHQIFNDYDEFLITLKKGYNI